MLVSTLFARTGMGANDNLKEGGQTSVCPYCNGKGGYGRFATGCKHCDGTGRLPLRVFRVDLGATYWVRGLSGTPAEMQMAIERSHGASFGSMGIDPVTPEEVVEMTKAEACDATCLIEARHHGIRRLGLTEMKSNMWAEGAKVKPGVVIACSEY